MMRETAKNKDINKIRMYAVVLINTESLWGCLLFHTKSEANRSIVRSDSMPRTCKVIPVIVTKE